MLVVPHISSSREP